VDLSTVYRHHADSVARWARRLAGPELDVEDIVHEVFLVVQRRLGEWRGEAKLTTWLYEITVRVVQARRRRHKMLRLLSGRRGSGGDRGPDHDLAQIAGDDPNPLDLLERREATEALYAILDGIGEKYRTVIILFELEGLSGQEIAAVTGCSVANVWVRLFRGREKVMRRFLAWEAKGTR
jgi:RNA polymerase sigma-70 factor (ECF subfamily)